MVVVVIVVVVTVDVVVVVVVVAVVVAGAKEHPIKLQQHSRSMLTYVSAQVVFADPR